MAGIKGMKHRRPRARKSSDQAVLTVIENRLVSHSLGETKMSPTEVMAARAVYDKLRPSLSAVEQTIVDPRDQADPTDILQRLNAMFEAKPELWDQLVALRTQVQQNNTEQHVTH